MVGLQSWAQYVRITNLPALYIETFDGYGITSKTVYKYARFTFVYPGDSIVQYDSVQVRGRGNSTWNMRKKPYRFKFAQKEKLLGQGYAKAKKWTLMANAGDKTLIRNALTSAMGEFLGLKFNPAYHFVDLTINGTYQGNYQISDQVEVRPHRVNVTEQDLPLTDTSDITGGYLLEVDGFQDGNCFTSSRSLPIRIHYPDEKDIASDQNSYIRKYINSFESLLFGSQYTDPERGYRPLVDSVSLANWYIATEVSANIDGFYSTYFYKEQQDPRLYFGPLWDYDIAYGNDSRKGDTSKKLMVDTGYGQTKTWMKQMWTDPWFSRLINRRYQEALDAGLTEHMLATIDSLTNLLARSQQRNYEKWGINTRMYNERVLYSSYDQYVSDLRSFITTHNAFLATTFAGKQPAEPTPAFEAQHFWYRITNANNGKAIDLVNQSNNSGTEVCIWNNDPDRESEQWSVTPVDGYFHIVNRQSGMALTDPTQGDATATTNLGTHLAVSTPNPVDTRQQWSIVQQGTEGYYNLVNRRTNHTANLSSGSSTNGTPILSYTTNDRNATSMNRLWYFIPDEEIIEIEDAMAAVEPEEYALGYDSQAGILHFGSETPDRLTFSVRVYNISGRLVGQFRADETFSTQALPHGTYVVTWQVSGHTRSTKFMK